MPRDLDTSPPTPDRTRWAALALVLAVFFIVGGAPAPHVNETHYLTKAKHYWDSSYCPGDFFLDSADPHLTFYWAVGWLTKWFSLSATAWIGRGAAWLLLAVGWVRLWRSVSEVSWGAPLAAALWLVALERVTFAGEWVVGGVEAKAFAYGFVLLGLAALARGRWTAPWIWFGMAAAFHVLVGAWAVLAALAVWATEGRAVRPPLRGLLPGFVVGGVLSLAGLLPSLALERGAEPTEAAEAARIYVFDRLPHHLAQLSLPRTEVTWRLTHLVVMTAAFFALSAWLKTSEPGRPGPGEPHDKLALQRITRFAKFALICVIAGLALEAALVNRPLAAARVLRYYWFRQADVAVPLAIALAGACLAMTLLRSNRRLAVVAGLAPVLWCGGELAAMSAKRWQDPTPPGAAKLEHVAAWQDACGWIRDHAPADAVFLVPRAGQSFKWYAARADVANWKDVPQDAASVVAWRRRVTDLFPTVERDGASHILDSPERLGTVRVRELARRYGASHVIARSFPPLDLPVVYPAPPNVPGDAYTVYATGESAGGGPR